MRKFGLLLFGLIIGVSAKAQDGNSLLWEVKSPKGGISYLYGTYHLLGGDFLAERPQVMLAFNNSQTLVVETEIDSSQLMALSLMAMMPDKSLKEITDSADYLLLKEKLEPILNMDLAVFDHFKPMVLSAQYAAGLMLEFTPDSLSYGGLPLDLAFTTWAKKENKKLVSLETMRQQFDYLFNGQTEEEQLEDLLLMIKDPDSMEEGVNGILLAYHANDLDGILEASQSMEDASGDLSILIDERNFNWIDILSEPLMDGGLFIAVGALHLPGETGLIKLLRAKGFTLTALN